MNTVENYRLIYDGAGMHDILGLAKTEMNARFAASVDSKALAEYFLDRVRFDSDFRRSHFISTKNYSMNVSKSDSSVMHQIDHIHENCAQEIRGNWTEPQLSDEEVVGALYADKIEKELAKIGGKKTFDMAL